MTLASIAVQTGRSPGEFLRLRALREANKLSVHVENPAKWYPEVITPERSN